MSDKIRVRIHGKDYGILELLPGTEYFAGRGSQSQIVLQNERGISRQHIKISFEDGFWTVQLLSRFGGLIYQGEEVQTLQLEPGVTFNIEPYEFIFEAKSESSSVEDTQALEEPSLIDKTLQDESSEIDLPSEESASNYIVAPEDNSDDQTPTPSDPILDPNVGLDLGPPENTVNEPFVQQENTDEHTMSASTSLIAHLRIAMKKSEPEQILKLEGEVWTAGRSPNSEIYINNKNISRKHFDITKQDNKYFITDHGSSNGTILNGETITPNEAVPLFSGDVIQIKAVTITFEVRDSRFDSMLAVLPTDNEPHGDVELEDPAQRGFNGPAVIREDSQGSGGGRKVNKFVIVVAVILCIVGFLLYEPETKDGQVDQGSETTNNNGLTGEKLQEVKTLYGVAKNQYMSGKYELCLSQLAKLHLIVPAHEDSKEIENYCEQAIAINRQIKDKDRLEAVRQQNEQKIKLVTSACKKKITVTTTAESMRECLSPAILIDPEHLLITDVLTIVEANQEERRIKQAQSAEQQRICNSANKKYNLAKSHESSGDIKKAIRAYNDFVSSNYSCLKDKQKTAKQAVARLKEGLRNKIKSLTQQCDKLFQEKKYQEAIDLCKQARKIDPMSLEPKRIIASIESKACTEVKVMYEDSVMEESMGNLDAAKQKWQDIVALGVKSCGQFKKSQRKLRKYGN